MDAGAQGGHIPVADHRRMRGGIQCDCGNLPGPDVPFPKNLPRAGAERPPPVGGILLTRAGGRMCGRILHGMGGGDLPVRAKQGRFRRSAAEVDG